jgi:hypothetical protein
MVFINTECGASIELRADAFGGERLTIRHQDREGNVAYIHLTRGEAEYLAYLLAYINYSNGANVNG